MVDTSELWFAYGLGMIGEALLGSARGVGNVYSGLSASSVCMLESVRRR